MTGADLIPGAVVGPGCYFTHPNGVVIGPGIRIGANATLASGVVLGVRTIDPTYSNHDDYATIGDGVFLGSHAVVLGAVKIGDGAMVAAQAVVRSDVEAGSIVAGNPAVHVGWQDPGLR